MTAYSDLGPTAPSRMEVYRTANELEHLARLARELSSAGPKADLPRAVATLQRARVLLGASAMPGMDGNSHG